MSKAFEASTETLGIGSDEAKRRAVAKFLIQLAQEDDSLDATTLRDRAVAAFGSVQPSNPRASAELTEKRWCLHGGEASAL